MGVFLIVNENDTISMIVRNSIWRNDTLSAITAGMVNVDYLFLMTDINSGGYYGLHTAGTILIDEGAIKAITNAGQKSSLFAAGIVKFEGNFSEKKLGYAGSEYVIIHKDNLVVILKDPED
ncbi:16260_t:CDS:2 [Funneliformis mosseae]|uniref:16260_t:CDS:1 n=1 Tax=Funneliformis mosseae TaxID=27381 RepID=A0A9N9CEN4_FUNMO|nr:16260_t:CDS:2 [Funneliformis mosseae]